MYYFISGLLYLFSLLPWKVLYLLSDCMYGLFYYVIKYRRGVVMSNLAIAFPEKSEQERTQIAKEFYHNFLDTFIETLKFLSLSDKDFSKRISGNFELLTDIYATGKNVQLQSGHFFNWEYMNWALSRNSPFPFIGVYAPASNKVLDKIIFKMRSRYRAILISVFKFKNKFHQLAKGRYALALIADQNPGVSEKAYWLPFFGKLTAFVTGPEKSARINNEAVVLAHFYKVKRGYYHVNFKLLTLDPREFGRGEITKRYVSYLENCIKKTPANYLWSHRRWKWEYKEEFKKNLVN